MEKKLTKPKNGAESAKGEKRMAPKKLWQNK